jgi:hypothetical protein
MEHTRLLLQTFLEVTVPLAIADLARQGGPQRWHYEQARAFGATLGEQGDQILFRGPETGALVGRLAQALAVLSFVPGGVHFLDRHWQGHAEDAP